MEEFQSIDVFESQHENEGHYSDAQIMTLRVMGYIVLVLLASNLVILIFNTFKYLIPLKVIKSPLLSLFYIFSGIITISRILEITYYVLPSANKGGGQASFMSLSMYENRVQEIANAVASIAYMCLCCLFVATMFQISSSIRMIDNDNIDMQKARRQKICIYVLAFTTSLIFAACVIILMVHYNIEQKQAIKYIYILAIVAYTVLPIAYFATLWRLIKSMQELKQQDAIHNERQSVQIQFIFFITSFISRTIWFIIELTLFDKSAENFAWQLSTITLYIPWNILPISYILWCHARTYKNVIEKAQDENQLTKSVEHQNSGRLLGEAVCNLILTDSEDESDSDKASQDCEYGTESFESRSQRQDSDEDFCTQTEVKGINLPKTNLLSESQKRRSRSTRVTKTARHSINSNDEYAFASVTPQNSIKLAKMNSLNQSKPQQDKVTRKASEVSSEELSKKRMSRQVASVELLGSSQGMQLILAADKHKKNKHISSKQKVAFVPDTNKIETIQEVEDSFLERTQDGIIPSQI